MTGFQSRIGAVAVALSAAAVAATSLAAPDEAPLVWPPAGPVWETDPEVAFAKARETGKGVFVYIATEACPHCKVMAREVWPKPAVIAAGKDVVCLAVYRWRKDATTPGGESKKGPEESAQDSDWAMRLDVKGYPQIRLLDGWSRPLPSSGAHEMDRNADQVVAAMAAARAEGRKSEKPAAMRVPDKLLARLAEKDRAAAAEPIGSVRCRTWLRALDKGEWKPADLAALFRADDDAVLRVRILERLGGAKLGPTMGKGYDDAVVEAVAESVDGANDYVRCAALRLLGRLGGPRAVKALRDTIAKALDGKSGWNNVNNVLCEAVEASIGTADPSLTEVLGRVVATQSANNYATVLATRCLVAIGKASGADAVRPHLERARKLEGANAPAIRKEVEGFLGK
jgi:thioredoxin family protein